MTHEKLQFIRNQALSGLYKKASSTGDFTTARYWLDPTRTPLNPANHLKFISGINTGAVGGLGAALYPPNWGKGYVDKVKLGAMQGKWFSDAFHDQHYRPETHKRNFENLLSGADTMGTGFLSGAAHLPGGAAGLVGGALYGVWPGNWGSGWSDKVGQGYTSWRDGVDSFGTESLNLRAAQNATSRHTDNIWADYADRNRINRDNSVARFFAQGIAGGAGEAIPAVLAGSALARVPGATGKIPRALGYGADKAGKLGKTTGRALTIADVGTSAVSDAAAHHAREQARDRMFEPRPRPGEEPFKNREAIPPANNGQGTATPVNNGWGDTTDYMAY